jgi:hypothetical protein
MSKRYIDTTLPTLIAALKIWNIFHFAIRILRLEQQILISKLNKEREKEERKRGTYTI